MSESSLSDSVVLRETKFSEPDSKGRVQLGFLLPSGRKVTSTDWLVPGEIKGKVLIAWANAIRAEDAFDIQQREEAEKLARAERRAQQLSSAVPGGSSAPAPSQPSSGPSGSSATHPADTSRSSSTPSVMPDDPRELILAKLSALRTEHAKEVALRDASIKRIAALAQSIDQWAAVMAGVTLFSPATQQSDEPTKDASATEPASVEPAPSESSTPPSSTGTDSKPHMSRSQRRKARHELSKAQTQEANPMAEQHAAVERQGEDDRPATERGA